MGVSDITLSVGMFDDTELETTDLRDRKLSQLVEKASQLTRDLRATRESTRDFIETLAGTLATDTVSDSVRNDVSNEKLFTINEILQIPKHETVETFYTAESDSGYIELMEECISPRLFKTIKDLPVETLDLKSYYQDFGSIKVKEHPFMKLDSLPPGAPMKAVRSFDGEEEDWEIYWGNIMPLGTSEKYNTLIHAIFRKEIEGTTYFGAKHLDTKDLWVSKLTDRELDIYRRGEQSLEDLKDFLLGSRDEGRIEALFKDLDLSFEEKEVILFRCGEIYRAYYLSCENVKTAIEDLTRAGRPPYLWLLDLAVYRKSPIDLTNDQIAQYVAPLVEAKERQWKSE